MHCKTFSISELFNDYYFQITGFSAKRSSDKINVLKFFQNTFQGWVYQNKPYVTKTTPKNFKVQQKER